MRFSGRVWKDGSHWLAEVPLFEALTQGRTRREALEMIEDWFASMVDRPGFSVEALSTGEDEFEVTSTDLKSMISLLLQRRRQESGLSLADAAERLGVKSRNAYARYERGDSVPTIEKLDQLLKAISPDRDVVLHQSAQR
ncbi:MAG: helix-turn-helix transcriptional regulator [Thermoanaerobaculia bacterium]